MSESIEKTIRNIDVIIEDLSAKANPDKKIIDSLKEKKRILESKKTVLK